MAPCFLLILTELFIVFLEWSYFPGSEEDVLEREGYLSSASQTISVGNCLFHEWVKPDFSLDMLAFLLKMFMCARVMQLNSTIIVDTLGKGS